MGVFREFFLIVLGGVLGAVFGTGFGALVAHLFPEFVALLWRPEVVADPVSLGAGMGMTCGLPIGAAAMAAARFVGAVRFWAGPRGA